MPKVGIEYKQWQFCFKLTTSFLELLGCHQKTSTNVLKEAVNIMQRWILSLHQYGLALDELVPLFPPNLDIYHEANQKLSADIVEKRFLLRKCDTTNVVQKVLDFIEVYRKECHSERNFPEPLTRTVCDEGGKKMQLIIGSFESPMSVRLAHLVNNYGIEPTACMLLRYESAGSGSYQWGDPVSVHRLYYMEFGARYEGFASPLNSRFLGQSDTHICSAFPDTDAIFGSLGNFFDVHLNEYEGGWTVNPPFIEVVLQRAAEKVLNALNETDKNYFFMNFPYWTDCAGWNMLNDSLHKAARFDFNAGEFLIQDSYGASLRPRMKLSIFVMGKPPPGSAPLERVREVVKRDKPIGF